MITISQAELNRVVNEAYRLGWRAAMDSLKPNMDAITELVASAKKDCAKLGNILNV